jgi:aminoglycoside phosphotransferase family enzyme/predicted kinase
VTATGGIGDQSEVIAFLSDAASYGVAGCAVEQIVTHCSIVFLIGEHAYKLKRAVRFSYLDYGTLALREKFCRAELVLNRRTAPAIYLRVRAVTRTPEGTLTFDGNGPVLDWVLEMRRFREEDLFDRMIGANRLTPALMRDLADHIALFHAGAEVTPQHGGHKAFADALAANYENLSLASPPLDRDLVDGYDVGARARVREIGALLDQRRGDGMVRRCHGDLHLRNICLFEGRPTLFDAIEFNDDFACIDVLYDLAFLLMDLVHRGRADLANLVFNRYLDQTGNLSGLPVLPLFLSTRAAVRAHVLGILARTSAENRAEAEHAATTYLALACTLLERYSPRLVAIGGFSGTGKSTVARALAPEFPPAPGARIIRSDVLRKRLAQVPPETRLPASTYTLTASERIYNALRAQCKAAVAAGYTVVADATFLRAEERRAIADLSEAAGVPFTGLWLEAPPEILTARILRRHNDASDADVAVLEQQLGADPGPIEWQRIDTSGDIAATITAVRSACLCKNPS